MCESFGECQVEGTFLTMICGRLCGKSVLRGGVLAILLGMAGLLPQSAQTPKTASFLPSVSISLPPDILGDVTVEWRWTSQAFMEIVKLKGFSIEFDGENIKDFDLVGR
jgi:hypothetical protein